MRIAILLVAFVAMARAVSIYDLAKEEWTSFKIQYRKSYGSIAEEQLRLKIYIESKYRIAKHNLRFNLGLEKYRQGLNQFADMLPEEVVRNRTGFRQTVATQLLKNAHLRKSPTIMSPANVELPGTVDWRNQGAVTSVKNQGDCGCCWAFATTGSLEGQHFRKTGQLVSLSEQNLVDCSKNGNEGCDGGLMDTAFSYIMENGGIDSEESYPYEGTDKLACRYSSDDRVASVTGYVDISRVNELALQQAVATVGPIATGFDASLPSFQAYAGDGVYDDPNCSTNQLNHAVLIVGYGTTAQGVDYWLVKNSWGEAWGNKGYAMIARNHNNQCGIATMASYPLV